MNKRIWLIALALFVVAAPIAHSGITKNLERSEVKPMHKWNVNDLYPTLEDFQKAKQTIAPGSEKLTAYKGRLGESAKTLKEALDLFYSLEMEMRQLESYASRLLDQDTRVSENKAYQDEVETIRAQFSAASSFIDPELTSLGEQTLDKFFEKEPGLAVYKYPISEILRRKKHILSEKEEAILAAAQDIAMAGYNAYGLFTDADMPRTEITLSDGATVKLTYPNFDRVRRSRVEKDRIAAFEAFFDGQYGKFKRLLAQTLYSQLKVHNFYSKMRGYDNTLEAALDYDGIDPKIYTSLIEAAHKNLPTFHRYLKLKARALGKTHLEYTDMYMPFTSDMEINVEWDEAKALLLEGLKPLGGEYVNTIAHAFDNGWIDVWPTEGKRSGAYSSGWSYETHPYVLMNYNETYSDALTLAHEMGHAMHSFNSNGAQPFPTADYSTFVAEVASTFNENLLNDYMLKKIKSEDEKIYLLGNYLDGTIKGTFFRQIQFAEFELMIHQKVEAGEALTDETLNKMYLDLTRKYYGHDQDIVNVPDMIAVEWAAIPHFYYNYYVFQYSTSVAAASYLAERVIDKQQGALERYTTLLKSGGSDNPVALLKNAGADMTNPETYDALMARANRYMDELENIFDKKGI